MWKIILIATCVLCTGSAAQSVYRNIRKRGAGAYAGGFSNSFAGNGGGGFTDGYGDYDDNYAANIGFGNAFLDPYRILNNPIFAQHAAQHNAIAATIAMGNAAVAASASNLPNDIQYHNDLIQQEHNILLENIRRQTLESINNSQKNSRYAPNYSAAAASFGPKGGFQSAFINPENPEIPNISNRFSPISPNGYKGVSVSSFSSSSNINGKETNYRKAQTTINDNGRITTYNVES